MCRSTDSAQQTGQVPVSVAMDGASMRYTLILSCFVQSAGQTQNLLVERIMAWNPQIETQSEGHAEHEALVPQSRFTAPFCTTITVRLSSGKYVFFIHQIESPAPF